MYSTALTVPQRFLFSTFVKPIKLLLTASPPYLHASIGIPSIYIAFRNFIFFAALIISSFFSSFFSSCSFFLYSSSFIFPISLCLCMLALSLCHLRDKILPPFFFLYVILLPFLLLSVPIYIVPHFFSNFLQIS